MTTFCTGYPSANIAMEKKISFIDDLAIQHVAIFHGYVSLAELVGGFIVYFPFHIWGENSESATSPPNQSPRISDHESATTKSESATTFHRSATTYANQRP